MGNPWLTGMPWASVGATPGVIGATASYPAGSGFPWAGQPAAAVPAYTLFTPNPGFAPTSLEFNALFNQRDNAILYNASAVGLMKALEDLPFGADGGAGTVYFGGQLWAAQVAYNAAKQQNLGATVLATVVGDIIDVSFSSSLYLLNSGTAQLLSMVLGLGFSENGGGYTNFDNGEAQVQPHSAVGVGGTVIAPVSLVAQRIVSAGHAGTFTVGVNGFMNLAPSGAPAIAGLTCAWSLRIRHLRPNP